jgi:hypothetical protein
LPHFQIFKLIYAGFTFGFFDLVALAGLDLPKDPWNLFPFAVFLSPLPMVDFFKNENKSTKIEKPPHYAGV